MSEGQGGGRRYSQEELALILRQASAKRERASAALPAQEREMLSAIFGAALLASLGCEHPHRDPGGRPPPHCTRGLTRQGEHGETWDTHRSVEWTAAVGLSSVHVVVNSQTADLLSPSPGLSVLGVLAGTSGTGE